jgi:hypothetical protein
VWTLITQPGGSPSPFPAFLQKKPVRREPEIAEPQKLDWIGVGQQLTIKHPVKGDVIAHASGRIRYIELWQRHRGLQVPWVPTGNTFLGFWLEGDLYLLNWQNRFYLFDEMVELSDVEIQRQIASYARRFAESDQTADVTFDFPPAVWHIDDIGKFQVNEVLGKCPHFRLDAVGRFVHASGDGGRALAVEDYEGSGAQDKAWIGYHIEESDIQST